MSALVRLDDLDTAIVRALLGDARLSNREVAARVGSTPTTVGARLERLQEAGVVVGSTLRLGGGALPGRGRLVEGRLSPAVRTSTETAPHVRGDAGGPRVGANASEWAAAADALAAIPGVLHAAVDADGRFLALTQVLDLDDEERILAGLRAAGGHDLMIQRAHLRAGGGPVHLFGGAASVEESCAVCGKAVLDDGLIERVDGRRVVFCCPSCRQMYQERYAAMKEAAKGD